MHSSGRTLRSARLSPASPSTPRPSWISAQRSASGGGRCARPVRWREAAWRAPLVGRHHCRHRVRESTAVAAYLTCVIAIRAGQFVLLERRPPQGIWGGLWGLPEFPPQKQRWSGVRANCDRRPDLVKRSLRSIMRSRTLTCRSIPSRLECQGDHRVMEPERYVWYNAAAPQVLGMPTPVKSLIDAALRPVLS